MNEYNNAVTLSVYHMVSLDCAFIATLLPLSPKHQVIFTSSALQTLYVLYNLLSL